MSYKLSIIKDLLDVLLFSVVFLTVGTWNYYFKKEYKNKFILPLKLRFYFLVLLIVIMQIIKSGLVSAWFVIVIIPIIIIAFKFMQWMETPAKDFGSIKISDLTTFGDSIYKQFYFIKSLYERSNKEITEYYYKCLWGMRKYSLMEYITKFTLFAAGLKFSVLVFFGGLMILTLADWTWDIFSKTEFPEFAEWRFLMVIFAINCLKSFKEYIGGSNTKDKNKKSENFDIIIRLMKKGSAIEYFYLSIFSFLFILFFMKVIFFFLLTIDSSSWLYDTSDFNNKFVVYVAVFVVPIILYSHYLINLKNIILNFVTKNEAIPKHGALFSTSIIFLSLLSVVGEKGVIYPSIFLTIGLLIISIIIAINYIFRKYVSHEMLPISGKTEAIFGIIGTIKVALIIIINNMYVYSFIIIGFIVWPLGLKWFNLMLNYENVKHTQKQFMLSEWNFWFRIYIMSSAILITIVVIAIVEPQPAEDNNILKIVFIVLLIFMTSQLIWINNLRKKSQKKETELIDEVTERIPLITRIIIGVDGPFLKES